MSEFINTADVIGDDEMCDQIIMRTVTEYKEDRITKVGDYAFRGCTKLTEVDLPNVTSLGKYAFSGCSGINKILLPKVTEIPSYSYPLEYVYANILDLSNLSLINYEGFHHIFIKAIIIRRTDAVPTARSLGANGVSGLLYSECYVYVPASMIDNYKAASNWSNFPEKFRALEDYTVDGTIWGELDESKI